jgi:hypothetical protein
MSKKDYSTIERQDIPIWENHEFIDFKTSAEMLEWVSNDKVNFNLSDKVYSAMIHCLDNQTNEIIVATITVENGSVIDVIIRKQNFQKIFSSYTERLLITENYEKLAVIKKQVQKYNLEIT